MHAFSLRLMNHTLFDSTKFIWGAPVHATVLFLVLVYIKMKSTALDRFWEP